MTGKLDLSSVTLVAVETRAHELMRMAIDECLARADFGGILICSDRFEHFNILGADLVEVEDWPEKVGWSRYFWQGVAPHVKTPQTLNIQWDSWIVNRAMWTNAYLDYDYIGAPWWHTDGHNVGNGGFCLRSKRLIDFVAANADRYPIFTSNDDNLICRKYRADLEREGGFRWAPDDLASMFSFESPSEIIQNVDLKFVRPNPDAPHFGFHAMRNWVFELNEEALLKRTRLALDNKYISGTRMVKELFSFAPWLPSLLEFYGG